MIKLTDDKNVTTNIVKITNIAVNKNNDGSVNINANAIADNNEEVRIVMENIDLSNDTELFSYVNNLESNDTISFVSKNDKKYITVTIAKCSDWQSLYIEGKKKYEHHNIDVNLALFDLINDAIYELGGNIESIEFNTIYVTDEYAEDVGFPDDIKDIPDEVIED